MDQKEQLKSPSLLSDDELLLRLWDVLKRSRRVESVLVAHIAEVDARRLYAREASSSMHKYATDVLHLSDAEAYLRITAARASRRYPVLLRMLEDGRLHLSGIAVLAPHLDKIGNEDIEEFLARATHKSKRDIQVLVAEIAPKPDVPPCIRKVPERRKEATPPSSSEEGAGVSSENNASGHQAFTRSGTSNPAPSTEPAAKARDPRERVEPLSPARYKVSFTASAELRGKLERLAALMPGVDLASMIEVAVTEKLERVEAKRYGKVKNPRKNLEDADTAPGVRGISAAVKRFVWARDGGQCTFESHNGRRCPERRGLQFHHDDPYGFGGDRSASNIRLLCEQHNMHLAEKDYGKEKMKQYRRSADRVREPSPSFDQLCSLLRDDERDRREELSRWDKRVPPALDEAPYLSSSSQWSTTWSRRDSEGAIIRKRPRESTSYCAFPPVTKGLLKSVSGAPSVGSEPGFAETATSIISSP